MVEIYVTQKDREMAREVWAPYATSKWELRGIMVERIAEAIATARQQERSKCVSEAG
jgi:hypothetical protein